MLFTLKRGLLGFIMCSLLISCQEDVNCGSSTEEDKNIAIRNLEELSDQAMTCVFREGSTDQARRFIVRDQVQLEELIICYDSLPTIDFSSL